MYEKRCLLVWVDLKWLTVQLPSQAFYNRTAFKLLLELQLLRQLAAEKISAPETV